MRAEQLNPKETWERKRRSGDWKLDHFHVYLVSWLMRFSVLFLYTVGKFNCMRSLATNQVEVMSVHCSTNNVHDNLNFNSFPFWLLTFCLFFVQAKRGVKKQHSDIDNADVLLKIAENRIFLSSIYADQTGMTLCCERTQKHKCRIISTVCERRSVEPSAMMMYSQRMYARGRVCIKHYQNEYLRVICTE